jgi:hypothetical protein
VECRRDGVNRGAKRFHPDLDGVADSRGRFPLGRFAGPLRDGFSFPTARGTTWPTRRGAGPALPSGLTQLSRDFLDDPLPGQHKAFIVLCWDNGGRVRLSVTPENIPVTLEAVSARP